MEYVDYSGDYDPAFNHSRFLKETLLNLLHSYAQYILRIDGYWYLNVMDRWGNDEALEADIKVWEKAQVWEIDRISKLLNIRGNDVLTVMKYTQASPWMWLQQYDIDIKNNDHAVITYHTCPTLAALEKEGKGREKRQCQEVEPRILSVIAGYFNPNIKITPLKAPPRTDYNDMCCQWEFKLERHAAQLKDNSSTDQEGGSSCRSR